MICSTSVELGAILSTEREWKDLESGTLGKSGTEVEFCLNSRTIYTALTDSGVRSKGLPSQNYPKWPESEKKKTYCHVMLVNHYCGWSWLNKWMNGTKVYYFLNK